MTDSTKPWISVNEQIPAIGQEVLFCGVGHPFIHTEHGYFVGNQPYDIHFLSIHNIMFKNIVTHWMSVPLPPILHQGNAFGKFSGGL
jgi:hypothetical protein